MPLVDDARIIMVRDQILRLRRDAPEAPADFYHALFERAPHLRTMFREEEIAGQGRKFMVTLGLLADRMERPEAFLAEVRELGRGHRAYGVAPEHFEPMREALLETLRAHLPDFDDEAEAAWRAVYDRVAAEMIAA